MYDGSEKVRVKGANCMDELYIQLISLYVVALLKNIWELGGPFIKNWFKQKELAIHSEKRKAERWAVAWLHENEVIRDEVED